MSDGRIQKEADRIHNAIMYYAWQLHAGEQDAVEEELARRVKAELASAGVAAALTRADLLVFVKMLQRILEK